MPYSRSAPLSHWLDARRRAIDTLADGHKKVGIIKGRGRPLDSSKPLAHAHLMVAIGQFQGFVRDLHDLAIDSLLGATAVDPGYVTILKTGLVSGRNIDRGNATQDAIKKDFRRIGLTPFDISKTDALWTKDRSTSFDRLVELRNVLAHGNQDQLDEVLAKGRVKDTVSWPRSQLPVLNRYAKALDKMVWNHLRTTTGRGPWGQPKPWPSTLATRSPSHGAWNGPDEERSSRCGGTRGLPVTSVYGCAQTVRTRRSQHSFSARGT